MRNNVSTIRFRRSVSKHSGAAANIGGSHYRRASPEIFRAVTLGRIDRPSMNERLSAILPETLITVAAAHAAALGSSEKCSRSNSASRPRAWSPIIECGTRRRFEPGSPPPTKPGLSTASHYAADRAIRSSTCGCVMWHTDRQRERGRPPAGN